MWLTGRSAALLVVSALALAVAVFAGIPALLYVVGLGVGLVLAAVLMSVLSRPRASAVRSAHPAITEPGGEVDVVVDLTIRSRLPVTVIGWSDRKAPALAGTANGESAAVGRDRTARIGYTVTGRRRGRHPVGPLTVRLGDAFGLTGRTVTVADVDHVVVLPRRVALPTEVGPAADADGTAQVHRSVGLGHDDVIARPYLPGDALKRWHWKATAHRGEPMVRQEETEVRPMIGVILDSDLRANDPEGFEWRVAAAASIVSHYALRGYDVDLVSARLDVRLDSGAGVADAMVALALLEPQTATLPTVRADRTTVVLTGWLDLGAARRLAAEIGEGDVVLLAERRSPSDAVQLVESIGWRVVLHDAHDELADVWRRAMAVPVP